MAILAGKIDGPTSTLAVFDYEFNQDREKYEIDKVPVHKENFTTKNYEDDMPKMIEVFLNKHPDKKEKIESACLGIAAPVIQKENEENKEAVVRRPGLEATVTEKGFSEKLYGNLPVYFINDMEAIGYSVFLGNQEEDLKEINQGNQQQDSRERRALMLVSAGLGRALWMWDEQEKEFSPVSSEGGHRDFSLTSLEDMKLWQYWWDKNNNKPISWEYFLSNRGLAKIYQFLKEDRNYEAESERVERAMENNENDSSLIIIEALRDSKPDPLCKSALEMFISLWGAEAGNIALDYVAKGGVYIVGNSTLIESFNKDELKQVFMDNFTNKGENAGKNHGDIPVRIYKEEDMVLRGAARFAARFIGENKLWLL